MEPDEIKNDMNLKVTDDRGVILIDEDCITSLNILLQTDGNLQTSFLGSYNYEILKTLHKELNRYFKNLKKQLLKRKPEDNKKEFTATENTIATEAETAESKETETPVLAKPEKKRKPAKKVLQEADKKLAEFYNSLDEPDATTQPKTKK